MKRTLTVTFIYLLFVSVLYILSAFVQIDFNPYNWSYLQYQEDRGAFAVILVIALIVVIGVVNIDKIS